MLFGVPGCYTSTKIHGPFCGCTIGVRFTGVLFSRRLKEARPTCAPIIVQIPWLAITWMPSLVRNFMARKGLETNNL